MGQAFSSKSLNLRYEGCKGKTDFDRILNQLRENQNVENIEFLTFGVGEQHNENVCKIIKGILRQPNLNKITYDLEEDLGDFNGMKIDGEFPKVIH